MDFPNHVLLPQKTLFKKGALEQLSAEVLEYGNRGLIVHGHSLEKNGQKDRILSLFPASATLATYCRSAGEPTLDEITAIIEQGKSIDAQWIVGIGGGSVLDCAKAAAGLFHATQKPVYYQEGGILNERGIPFIAVPTTAGTGSEATLNAVIINKEKGVKLSIRDTRFLAKTVILDVDLLKGLSRSVLSWAALDALVQAYESFTSKHATWFSDTFALKAINLINKNILAAYKHDDESSLASLLLASYFSGIALAAARLGVIHGIAHPLGVIYNLPHGLICSVCFVPSIILNKQSISAKYDILSHTTGMDFLKRIHELLAALAISSPFKGNTLIEKEKIIQETIASGSTAANPKPINRHDVEWLLTQLF